MKNSWWGTAGQKVQQRRTASEELCSQIPCGTGLNLTLRGCVSFEFQWVAWTLVWNVWGDCVRFISLCWLRLTVRVSIYQVRINSAPTYNSEQQLYDAVLCVSLCKVLYGIRAMTQKCRNMTWITQWCMIELFLLSRVFYTADHNSRPNAYTDNLFCKLSALVHLSHV